jgi:RNA polymerase sigma factor (sigma-70 family)
MDWLNQVAKYHNEWLSVMYSFGAKSNAEDFVQEVYIRLAERVDEEKMFYQSGEKKGEVNKSYVYFALRSLWVDYKRKHRKYTAIKKKTRMQITSIENLVKYKHDKVLADVENKSAYNPLSDVRSNDDLQMIEKKYEIILDKVNTEIKSWHWYDQLLFVHYVQSGKSIRTLAKETKISRDSIFQTLKNCKKKIINVVGEDWQDFKNKDFELINK